MPNKNALNKNSLYVSSLVNFILDTKPYHVKLTEIVEEYRFFDDVKVKIEERFTSKAKIDSTWMYNYFSSANPMFRTMPAQRLTAPTFRSDSYVVGQDENKDLSLVPFVYSKKTFDGLGVNAVYVRHKDFSEALTESTDYFQSHGSFQFQIKQTYNANQEFVPLWATTPDDDLITEARRVTRLNALDRSNPASAINMITGFLNDIQAAVNSIGGHFDVQRELNALFAILNSDDLPQSYEALLAWLAIPNDDNILVPLEFPKDREYYEQRFSDYSSPLFFGMFTDLGVRESGKVEYESGHANHIKITNLKVAEGKDIEEWTFTATDIQDLYRVTGSSSGFIGFVTSGDSFDNGRVSFKTQRLSPSVVGDTVGIAPTRKLVIGQDAPLETWNIIKVNPIAHDRPQFNSQRYGFIQDLNGNIGNVSLLDPTLPTGDITLTSRGDNTFDLQSDVTPSYKAIVTVGQLYNDGKIAFTIVKGLNNFPRGAKFYIAIENIPAMADGLELGYGYDLDPYDDDTITKYPTGENIGFFYDTRFTDFDLTSLNLKISDVAVNGRKWRLRALPDYTRPISNVTGIPTPQADLQIYYAGSFALEFSDNDFLSRTRVDTIQLGGAYTSATHGISFTLASGSKPFVAVSADDNGLPTRIEGGDIFSFTIKNPAPSLIESPIGLSSLNVPRLIMHSDSFFNAPQAKWVVNFTDSDTYTVTGTAGEITYGPVIAKLSPKGIDTREGNSFRELNVHFTIVPTGGMVAGDKFTFNTFDDKPSYLVHGSVTGFTAPATVGKYYWNGKIGFKIRAPYVTTYVNGREVKVADGAYTVREDCPSLIYTFVKNAFGYQITRSDTGESGFGNENVAYQDKYLKINLTGITEPEFKLSVDAHDYPLWNTADVIIINPKLRSRLPKAGEKVVVEKTEEGKFSLNLVPGVADISSLNPVTVDQRFIDVNTHGLPLALTSPETALLQGWVPLMTEKMDSSTSVAEFSDPATSYIFRSSASNQKVGMLKDNVFEWDEEFYSKFLPLNAEANLIIQGTGWNDRVSVKISESIKLLIGGGALTEDWLFKDEINVKIVDTNHFDIVATYNDDIQALVDDGPFGGFLSGYGNVPYDTEGYDAGQPPDLYSMLGKYSISEQQQSDILSQWNNYLQNPAVIPTTEQQWAFVRAALAGDPNPGFVTDEIGFPSIGMGMDISTKPENSASAAIAEAMTIKIVDRANLLESNNYDIGLLDSIDENTAILYVSGSLPIPSTGYQPGDEFESFDTPLSVDDPARIFELFFNNPQDDPPKVSIWLEGEAMPIPVGIVENLKSNAYRFSIPRPSRAKIIIG